MRRRYHAWILLAASIISRRDLACEAKRSDRSRYPSSDRKRRAAKRVLGRPSADKRPQEKMRNAVTRGGTGTSRTSSIAQNTLVFNLRFHVLGRGHSSSRARSSGSGAFFTREASLETMKKKTIFVELPSEDERDRASIGNRRAEQHHPNGDGKPNCGGGGGVEVGGHRARARAVAPAPG